MQRRLLLLATAAALTACATPGSDPGTALARAEAAMGATGLRSLQFSASGTGATFGQAFVPGQSWPKLSYSSFSRTMDYEAGAMREDWARSRAEPTGGGATPLMGTGEQRSTGFVAGTWAWNLAGSNAAAAPVALEQRLHDLWTSPHGVLRAARRQGPTAGRDGAAFAVAEPGRYSAQVWLDESGRVARVVSRQPNPVMGDIELVTDYLDYRNHAGVAFPSHIRQSQGGHPVLDLRVASVQVNAPLAAAVPEAVRGFAERVAVERVADGVWFLAGGSHNSVLIELADQLVLVEAPLYDGRSAAVLAEAKKLAPGKPLHTVINSHHHFDHAGGLRTAVADGATLVVSAAARPWFASALANPNRLAPDALARSGRSATLVGVAGRHRISDGRRTIDIHEIEGSVHAQGFLMIHLPAERLLIEADAYTPGAPGAAPPAVPNANHVNLVANIERLQLGVDRLLPLHGRVVPMSELLAAIGRK